ncbi:MAG: hypothetical protein CM15mV28_0760 [Thaumasvirus sp.]|nr:MAG: hypothetical protein CM15mV28_0760 [Thaumasvirus sp.]
MIVVELEIPITLPRRGDTNTMQSRLSSAIFTREVTLARAAASSAPEGPAIMKSMSCDSGSCANSYAVEIPVLVIV